MTAPIASGWCGCRVGLAPTGKRRLCTAHAKSGNQNLFVICELPQTLGIGNMFSESCCLSVEARFFRAIPYERLTGKYFLGSGNF
jgi:hypothetical protein